MFTSARARRSPTLADPLIPLLLPGEALTTSQSARARTLIDRIHLGNGDITARGARLIAEESPKQRRLWTLIADHLTETGLSRVSEIGDRRLIDFVAADINPALAAIPTQPSAETLQMRLQLFQPLTRPPFTEFQQQYRQRILTVCGTRTSAELRAASMTGKLTATRALWLARVSVQLEMFDYRSLNAVPASEYYRLAYEYLPAPGGPQAREFGPAAHLYPRTRAPQAGGPRMASPAIRN